MRCGEAPKCRKVSVMARIPFVDREECTGCELCASNLPDVFRMNADGLAECYNAEGASEEDIQREAMDVCPVECIHWEE